MPPNEDNDGATPRELILEACRRNNADLLSEVLASTPPASTSTSTSTPPTKPPPPAASPTATPAEQAVAALLNSIRDPLGLTPLHVAAAAGAYETLDVLLDQPGVEVDPVERREGDTPLHKAVRFANEAGGGSAAGTAVVEILVDAGCDPRVRNKARLRAVELVQGRDGAVRDLLRRAEMAVLMGGDVVDEDEDVDGHADGEGSGSETD